MKDYKKEPTRIVCVLGIIPLFVIKTSMNFDKNNYLYVHKTYWLFGIIPLFSTERDKKGVKND